jgi:hypothetical protein
LRKTPLIVDLDFRKSAEKFGDRDLLGEVCLIPQLIQEGCGAWAGYQGQLAAYGLILLNEYKARGFDLNIKYLKFYMKHVRGVTDMLPEWIPQYVEAHKRFLCCVGWVRYLKGRGFSDSNCKELTGYEKLIDAVGASDGDTLVPMLQKCARYLKLRKSGVIRLYSDFDPPGLPRLCPEAT